MIKHTDQVSRLENELKTFMKKQGYWEEIQLTDDDYKDDLEEWAILVKQRDDLVIKNIYLERENTRLTREIKKLKEGVKILKKRMQKY